MRFAVINLDLWQWQTHLDDTDGFLSDSMLIFPVTLSSHKVWRIFVKSSSHPVHSYRYSLAFFFSWHSRTYTIEPITAPFEQSTLLYYYSWIYMYCQGVWIKHNLQTRFIRSLTLCCFPQKDPAGIGLSCSSGQSKCWWLPQKDKTS